eukprot:6449889-Prorocentrum_lima.AAC.1
MTSSLVGSEMCIRDRWGIPTQELCVRAREGACPRLHRTASFAARQQPVSYTHLTLPTICSV